MEKELIIDDKNFHQYFKDVRLHKPEKDQVLARFRAVVIFSKGQHKRDVITLLKRDKAQQAAAMMQRMHLARVPDCYRVCREICEDLISGMSDEDVLNKQHEYLLEALYYVKPEYVPKNDPHWELVNVVEYDEEKGEFKARDIVLNA